VVKLRRVGPIRCSAEYNSAIRQIENLRYKPSARRMQSLAEKPLRPSRL
jgi:hypothetical protein